MPERVSIVICCHNSAQRLPPTLAHLAAQHVGDGLPWEVVVVDNGSTDGTADLARACWPAWAPVPLRVVAEPELGLSAARRRGFFTARYGLVSFVDDDNWVCPEWVELVASVMGEHPEVGACGGRSVAVCEREPPPWFERHKGHYAAGAQAPAAGSVLRARGWLWGAGLTVRKRAWEELIEHGFHPILAGRTGARLTCGEDVELCYALRLAGWDLWYDPRLTLRHFLPSQRLDWGYLRRMSRGFGAANFATAPYRYAIEGGPNGLRQRLRWLWFMKLAAATVRLAGHGHRLLLAPMRPFEGDEGILRLERDLGAMAEALGQRHSFGARIREFRDAPWRQMRGSDCASQSTHRETPSVA